MAPGPFLKVSSLTPVGEGRDSLGRRFGTIQAPGASDVKLPLVFPRLHRGHETNSCWEKRWDSRKGALRTIVKLGALYGV